MPCALFSSMFEILGTENACYSSSDRHLPTQWDFSGCVLRIGFVLLCYGRPYPYFIISAYVGRRLGRQIEAPQGIWFCKDTQDVSFGGLTTSTRYPTGACSSLSQSDLLFSSKALGPNKYNQVRLPHVSVTTPRWIGIILRCIQIAGRLP